MARLTSMVPSCPSTAYSSNSRCSRRPKAFRRKGSLWNFGKRYGGALVFAFRNTPSLTAALGAARLTFFTRSRSISGDIGLTWRPIQPRVTTPFSLSWPTTIFTVSAGTTAVAPTTGVAKDRDQSRWRAIPESDFAINWANAVATNTVPRSSLGKEASEVPQRRNGTGKSGDRLSPFASFAGARCDPASVRLRIRMENTSRGRNYLPVRRWRAEHLAAQRIAGRKIAY
jgi:hypothetical protein